MAATHVLDGTFFAINLQSNRSWLRGRSSGRSLRVPFSWVAANSVYGAGDIERVL
jgi:hypothetical protein